MVSSGVKQPVSDPGRLRLDEIELTAADKPPREEVFAMVGASALTLASGIYFATGVAAKVTQTSFQ
jgi:hypothetical protein